VNVWLVAAAGLLLALVPCLLASLRGGPLERLVAAEMAGLVTALLLFALARGFGRTDYLDASLFVALFSFPSGLVFTRFLERWL
jgi:multisubunit Na+/H+ antiporter MnhF subunit